MSDLVIANGTVVMPEGTTTADILIEGETIKAIADPGSGKGDRVIDASGKIVIPGGVDPHVHLLVGFMGQRSVYDFESGGIAALRGGTTSIIDFALQRRGKSMLAGLAHRRKQADLVVTVDYGLHLIATDVNDETLRELPALRAGGVSSLKVYMVYEEDGLKLDDGPLYRLMQQAAKHDLMIALHAENAGIVEDLRARAVAEGNLAPHYHALTRPPITEIEAISRAIHFSEATGCGVHILHLSAQGALPLIEAARKRGIKVTAETCTHYLALTDEALKREDGHNFILSPPLRDADNQAALWDALRGDVLSAVTSDEVSYSAAAKALGLPSFADVANGCPGIEMRLPVLFTLGVASGRISLEQFVRVTSTLPADIFGIGDRKGRITPGHDADIAILDPEQRQIISPESDYGDIGYNPYSGIEVTGIVDTTLLRGKPVVSKGKFLGHAGQGRFLTRGPSVRPVSA